MDIVDELTDLSGAPSHEVKAVADKAIKEIERLRKVLQKNLRPQGETIHGVIDWIKEEPDRLMQFRAALKETE